MNEPKNAAELEAALAEKAANGEDVDPTQAAMAAAQIAGDSQTAPRQLDPNRPMWHLVPPSTMQDVLAILKRLPYEDVNRVMPALLQAPLHQDPPG